MLKVGDKLICIKEIPNTVKLNQCYTIKRIDNDRITIDERPHLTITFTILPDEKNLSYKDWLCDEKEYRCKKIKKINSSQ